MKKILIGLGLATAFFSLHADKTDLKLTGSQGVHHFLTLSKPWIEDSGQVERVLRGICYGKNVCFAHIWETGDAAPKGFPLSDKDVETEVATFRINQNTKSEELLWNCKRWKDKPKNQCFSS